MQNKKYKINIQNKMINLRMRMGEQIEYKITRKIRSSTITKINAGVVIDVSGRIKSPQITQINDNVNNVFRWRMKEYLVWKMR